LPFESEGLKVTAVCTRDRYLVALADRLPSIGNNPLERDARLVKIDDIQIRLRKELGKLFLGHLKSDFITLLSQTSTVTLPTEPESLGVLPQSGPDENIFELVISSGFREHSSSGKVEPQASGAFNDCE